MSNYSEEEKVHSTTRIETNNQLRAPHGGELNPGVHAPVAAQKVRSLHPAHRPPSTSSKTTSN